MRTFLFACLVLFGLAGCAGYDGYDDDRRHYRGYDRDDHGYSRYYPYGQANYPRDRIWIIDGYRGCRYYSYQGYCYRYKDDYYRAIEWDRRHGYDDNWHRKRKDWCNKHDCRRDHDTHHRGDGRWDDDRQPETRRYRQETLEQPRSKDKAVPVSPPPKRPPGDQSGSGWGGWGDTGQRHDRVPAQGRPSPGWEPPADSRPARDRSSSTQRYGQQPVQSGASEAPAVRSGGSERRGDRQRSVDTGSSSGGTSDATGKRERNQGEGRQRGQRAAPVTDTEQ